MLRIIGPSIEMSSCTTYLTVAEGLFEIIDGLLMIGFQQWLKS